MEVPFTSSLKLQRFKVSGPELNLFDPLRNRSSMDKGRFNVPSSKLSLKWSSCNSKSKPVTGKEDLYVSLIGSTCFNSYEVNALHLKFDLQDCGRIERQYYEHLTSYI